MNEKEAMKFGRARGVFTVHAEILVADLFNTHELTFFDNDRYMACSKAACYCCYYYLKDHPSKSNVPACHGNAYSRWKLPDIGNGTTPGLLEHREKFLIEMTRVLRKGVLDQLTRNITQTEKRSDSM